MYPSSKIVAFRCVTENEREKSTLPLVELEDVPDLVLDLGAVLELVDVDKEKVDAVVAVCEHDENDEGDADQPGHQGALEEGVFHELGKGQHYRRPQVDRDQTGPQLPNRLIKVRRIEVKPDKQQKRPSENNKQNNILILLPMHQRKTEHQHHLIAQQQKVPPRINPRIRVRRRFPALEIRYRDHERNREEQNRHNPRHHREKHVLPGPALQVPEVRVRFEALGVLGAV